MTTNVVVDVQNGDVNTALRRLRKQLQVNGTIREIRQHAQYMKPSVAKRRKSALARARLRKAEKHRRERELQNPNVHWKDRVA